MKVKEKTKIVYSMKALCGGSWPAMLCREGGHTCMAWQATPCHTHAKKKKIFIVCFLMYIYMCIYIYEVTGFGILQIFYSFKDSIPHKQTFSLKLMESKANFFES